MRADSTLASRSWPASSVARVGPSMTFARFRAAVTLSAETRVPDESRVIASPVASSVAASSPSTRFHATEACSTEMGVTVFEGGAGGEHKLARGFLPALTYSAHGFLDDRLDAAVRDHLRMETPARTESVERYVRESPIFKKAS